eukprot:scaffold825_cov249-Pinguiococcus_pyrenoidosus.AAC.49
MTDDGPGESDGDSPAEPRLSRVTESRVFVREIIGDSESCGCGRDLLDGVSEAVPAAVILALRLPSTQTSMNVRHAVIKAPRASASAHSTFARATARRTCFASCPKPILVASTSVSQM